MSWDYIEHLSIFNKNGKSIVEYSYAENKVPNIYLKEGIYIMIVNVMGGRCINKTLNCREDKALSGIVETICFKKNDDLTRGFH